MKKSHGGKRKNSGRPPTGTQQYVARLTINQVKWLQSIDDAGSHLQAALAHYMATRPTTKRRAKRPEWPRQRPIVPKDAPTYGCGGYGDDLMAPETPSFIPNDVATKNAETAKDFGKSMSSPATAARLTVAEVRAAKQAAYQKTLN